jgi:hypothetical protein
MDHPRAGLRYVDASDLDDSTIDFDGLAVESQTGDKLGDVDGFIIDTPSARPLYIVVDAGGWFRSKYFLLPVGHVGLDADREKLVADLPRDRVKNFPGFDRDEFDQLTDAELTHLDEEMVGVCCPNETIDRTVSTERYDRWTHYRNPTWWDASYYRPDRADNAARSMASTGATSAASASSFTPVSKEAVRAERDRIAEREAVTAREGSVGDVSPHLGGRAQPGDVLGIETGGEQTHVGETNEDENKRREDAQRKARDKR